jgi:hypothetical protein
LTICLAEAIKFENLMLQPFLDSVGGDGFRTLKPSGAA